MPPIAAPHSTTIPTERLAVNALDLEWLDPTVLQLLLGGKVDFRREALFKVDPTKPDEIALPFVCDLLTAATACDVLRSENRKLGDPPSRVYFSHRRGGIWVKLGAEVVLTVVVDSKCQLDPRVFNSLGTTLHHNPLRPKSVI